MRHRFYAEDIFPLILDDLVASPDIVEIEIGSINRFRNNLRKYGYVYELDYYELNSITREYPNNLMLETSALKVRKSDSFVEIFKSRKSTFLDDELALFLELWNMSK